MNQHLKLLGFAMRDVITGFTGIVSCISFDLAGCVQAIVTPGIDKEGKVSEGKWFDTKRLQVTSTDPVMEVPTFGIVPGGQELPDFPSKTGV